MPERPELPDPKSQAVNALTRAVLGRVKNDTGVHAETAIAAAAGMAGTCLLRSQGRPLDELDPGTTVAGDAEDTGARELVAAILDSLETLGIDLDPAAIPAELPREHRPQLSLLQVQLTVGVPYREAIRQQGLDQRAAAFASAVAAARIIHDAAAVLDPALGMAIAVRACNEGVTTVPVRLPGDDGDGGDDGPRKPWYRFW